MRVEKEREREAERKCCNQDEKKDTYQSKIRIEGHKKNATYMVKKKLSHSLEAHLGEGELGHRWTRHKEGKF